MLNITDEINFDVTHGLYVVKFWATWCPHCKSFAPIIEKLNAEFDNIDFLSVDIDKVPQIAKQYKIKSLPTILVLFNGKEIKKIPGVQLIEPLRATIREAVKNTSKF